MGDRYLSNEAGDGKNWEYLRPWNWISCEKHYNILWRFDGLYLIRELGNYLIWRHTASSVGISSIFYSINHQNGKKIVWEYDPQQKYLSSPGSPVWLTRICTPNTTSPSAKPRCSAALGYGPIKVDNPVTTTHNEMSEQLFTLNYQGERYWMNLHFFPVYDRFVGGSSCYRSMSTTLSETPNKLIVDPRTTTKKICGIYSSVLAEIETNEEANQVE